MHEPSNEEGSCHSDSRDEVSSLFPSFDRKKGIKIVALSVEKSGGTKLVDIYNPLRRPSRSYPCLPFRQYNASLALLGHQFYVTGGFIEVGSITNAVMCLNPMAQELMWAEFPTMIVKRAFHASMPLNGKLYVSGGCKEHGVPMSKCEFYFPPTAQWKLLPSMLEKRSHHSMTSVKGLLYALGGITDNGCHSWTMEQFNPGNRTWTVINRLRVQRESFAAVSHQDRIYILGGRDGKERPSIIPKIDCWSEKKGCWEECGEMIVPNHTISACTFQDQIFTVGGYQEQMEKNYHVRMWDPGNKKWTLITVISDENHVTMNSLVVV